MVRGWLILSTLTLGVIFRAVRPFTGQVGFVLTDRTIDKQSWVYYTMEHINAIAIASCILIHDNTPRWLLWIYFYILVLDLAHYILFFRDEGIGFNLVKVVIFSGPFLWIQLKQQLKP